jgi:hypothetical protein
MFLLALIFVTNSLLAQDYQTSMEKVVFSYERIGQKLSARSTDGIETEAQTIITITSDLREKRMNSRSKKNAILELSYKE